MKPQQKGSLADQLKAQLGLAENYEPEEVAAESAESSSSSSSAMRSSLSAEMRGHKLIVSLEKKGRAGKQVTLIQGFTALDTEDSILPDEEIEPIAKTLKTRLGVGGTIKLSRETTEIRL